MPSSSQQLDVGVSSPGATTVFPTKSDRRRANYLPASPTALIGREQEITAACTLLRRPDVRLVTLIGPGGAGKTRLAIQVATDLCDAFRNGVWFVALAPISDATLVVTVIAQVLDIRECGDRFLVALLKEELWNQQLLLLLDNFEQIMEAAPLVAELLQAVPGLKVLVTSRQIIHLNGEHQVMVPPLGVPNLVRIPPLDELKKYDAIRLFVDRAGAVRSDFAITDSNAGAIAEICARLDGLPLAIELAAARSTLFAPQALLTRLSNRLKLLTSGARDLPERQRTLRSALDWSYDLLSSGEQALFRRQAVFVGGCTEEMAEAVCNLDGDLPLEMLDGLAALAEKSLLRQEVGADGEPRFVMLETIREYAREKLEASGEAAMVRDRHLAFFLTLVEGLQPRIQKTDPMAWWESLELEHDNLRAALSWSQTHIGSVDRGERNADRASDHICAGTECGGCRLRVSVRYFK